MKLKVFGRSGSAGILAAVCSIVLACALSACSSTGTDDPADPVDPVKSATCTLSALTVSAGTLTPAFDPAVTSYVVDVESSVKSITVSGTAADAKATVSESGTAARTLAPGSTTIVLTVTAEDGTAKAYSVTAFRKPVVYAAGWYMADAKYTPCYWKGTERIDLDIPADRSYLDVKDIVVVDGSVYVSGYYKIYIPDSYPPYVACYWKDGVRTDLATVDATTNTTTLGNAIAVSGGSVYVAGCYYPDDNAGNPSPCYWKDGVLTALDHPDDKYVEVASLTVADGVVYSAGMYMPNDDDAVVCYWKGTTRTDLPVPSGTNYSYAKSIKVSGGSVYVAGTYSSDRENYDATGALWKDGVRTDVASPGSDMTKVYGIAVEGDTVWLVGNDDTGDCMWKGSERIVLPAEGYSYAMDIAILDGRAWCAGRSSVSGTMGACVWENGVRRELTASGSSESRAIALGE